MVYDRPSNIEFGDLLIKFGGGAEGNLGVAWGGPIAIGPQKFNLRHQGG